MSHFVHDHVIELVFGLFHWPGVQADVPGRVIAASPLDLHESQEISGDRHLKLCLPLANEPGHDPN